MPNATFGSGISDCEYYQMLHEFRLEDHPDFNTWRDLNYKEVNLVESAATFDVSNDGTTSSRFKVVRNLPASSSTVCPIHAWNQIAPYFLNSFVDFTIEHNPTPEKHGIITIISQSATEVEFEYTHPTDPPEPGEPTRNVFVTIWGPPNNPHERKWAQLVIQVHRTPVVMVHGLWSNGSAFSTMEAEMINAGNYLSRLLYRADYKQSNSSHFYANKNVVPDAITALIQKNVDASHAAGKVDVVGHSMGGILTRNYIQNSGSYRGDVRRVITCNTPHGGSQMANFLLDYSYNQINSIICGLLSFQDMTCHEGAVEDLQVGSFPIELMNMRRANHPSDVAVHALTTVAPSLTANRPTSILMNSSPIALISQLLSTYTASCSFDFISALFNQDDHDAIVALESQTGGLQGNLTSAYANQIHMGSTDNSSVINRVMELLQEKDPSQSFTTSGYDPGLLSYISWAICPSPAPPPRKSVAPSPAPLTSLTITSPANGATLTAGQAAEFAVTGANPDSTLMLLMDGPGDALLVQYEEGSNATFNVAIPDYMAGLLKVRIYSLLTNGLPAASSQDNYAVVVAPTSQVTGFEVYPNPVYLKVGQSRRIEITGTFEDGIARDIAAMPDVAMTMETPRAAVSNGLVTLLWPTNNILNVSVNGITNAVNVVSLGYDGAEVGLDLSGGQQPSALAIEGLVQGAQVVVEKAVSGIADWNAVDSFTSAGESTNRSLPGGGNPTNSFFRVMTIFE